MTKFKFLIYTLVLVLVACGGQDEETGSAPADILTREKMVSVLTDIRLAEANARVARQMQQYEEHMLDSAYFVIYKIHDISSADLQKSLEYYGERMEEMKEINEKVLENLNRLN